jgi:hypothetical protein
MKLEDYPSTIFLNAPARILLAILVFLAGSGVGQVIAFMSVDDWWGIGHWRDALVETGSWTVMVFAPFTAVLAMATVVGGVFPLVNFYVFWKNLSDDVSHCRAWFIYAVNQVLMFGLLIIFNVGDFFCVSKMGVFKFFAQAGVVFALIYFGHQIIVRAINRRLLPFIERKLSQEKNSG